MSGNQNDYLPEPAEDIITRYKYTLEQSPEAIFWLEKDGSFSYVNKQACNSLGYSREELLSLFLWDIDPDFPRERWDKQWSLMKKLQKRTFETRHQRKDGHIFPVEVSACQVNFRGREFHASFVRDISERKETEEQQKSLQAKLLQAQKMESIGRLAGGVAHDFNNILNVILGHTDLALEHIDSTHPAHKDLIQIHNATRRSADLTRQLLAFARRQTTDPSLLNPDDIISDMLKMLGRLIGEDIELIWEPGNDSGLVKIDPAQVDQILANLCVNARDAIAGPGKVTIETGSTTLNHNDVPEDPEFQPGPYIMLAVSDTGCGMNQETRARIFEPFYSTKDPARGTGLGLSTVYGIVQQNKGIIRVDSTPGQGTTFTIYLPRYEVEDRTSPDKVEEQPLQGGNETVLLVEDETMVLDITRKMLESLGYLVLTANSPLEALYIPEKYSGRIDLLITDVVMPEMNGTELAGQLLAAFPGMKILYISGYTFNVTTHREMTGRDGVFLAKPFSKKELAVKIREVLA